MLLGVILRWSRRPSPELRLELAACRGALLTVVDNHHLQLILVVVLSRDLVTTYPCPVFMSRRAGQEGYKGVKSAPSGARGGVVTGPDREVYRHFLAKQA